MHSQKVLTLVTAVMFALSAAGAEKPAVSLFNGRDLTAWRQPTGKWTAARKVSLSADDPAKFQIESGEGILVNGPGGRTINLISRFEHGDVEAHIEFVVPKNSNSGVYFQGRYEVQILDSWGKETVTYGDCGGIYERWANDKGYEGQAPRVNASKAPGEWQTFDVLFRAPRFDRSGKKIQNARFVKVTHNGKVIHENVEVTGPTRAAVYENDEKPKGPLMLQGDHGPVAFRNLSLKPIELP